MSSGGDSEDSFSTDPEHACTGPRVQIAIDYDPDSLKLSSTAPEPPKALYNTILKAGCDSGYRLHSKDCDVEWSSLQYDVCYRKNDKKNNTLHMTICIGWPTPKTKAEDPKKMQDCVLACVHKCFGINENSMKTDFHEEQ